MRDGVESYLSALESRKRFSGNTISAYRNDLQQFETFLRRDASITVWEELTEEQVRAFALFLRERDYAKSTVARKTAAVRSFCNYLVEQGVLRTDPSSGLSTPRVEKALPRVLAHGEVELLLAAPAHQQSSEALRDLAMLKVLYGAGMRVSELVELNVDDLDTQAMQVRCPGKNGRSRVVAISPDVVETVTEYLERARPVIVDEREQPSLFVNHRGQRLTRQGFWLILKGYAETTGIDGLTPHTLRHTFAAHQLLDGRTVAEVQAMLGHVSPSTTQVYEQLASAMRTESGHEVPEMAGVTEAAQ
jgi:integrase/recombinase XerD